MLALRELRLVGREYEWEVREHGDGRAERFVYEHLLVRVREVILSAYDVRDAHRYVVHDDREIVERREVARAQQHEVFYLGVFARLLAVDRVFEARRAFARDLQAHGERLARFGTPIRLFERQISVRITSVVSALGRAALPRSLGYLLLDVPVRARALRSEVAVGLALFDETLRGRAVLVGVTRLEDYLLVKVTDAEPREPFEYRARGLVGRALLVCVLHAQEKLAALLARVEPVEQRRAR